MYVTPDTLNGAVEFDSPFRVNSDGTITTPLPGVYGPEGTDVDGQSDDPTWSPVNGWSGQYRYAGPVMHPSEYLGGRMARWVLDTPGVYVLTEARDEDGEFPDGDPVGWVLLTLDTPED